MPDRKPPLTVLIVDDSGDFLSAVTAWIEREDSLRLVGTARDGAEALEAIALLRPELVLMDAFMPGLDGFEATRRIKSQSGAPLVVILSVHEGSAMEHEAWAAGAEAFVPKSDFLRVLPETLRSLAGGTAPERHPRLGNVGGSVGDRPVHFRSRRYGA